MSNARGAFRLSVHWLNTGVLGKTMSWTISKATLVAACTAVFCMSFGPGAALAQAYKNDSDQWIKAIGVSGSKGEPIGWVYVAPHSTLTIGPGTIDHGAGKFIAEPSSKMVMGCFTSDKPIDFVAVEISTIEWDSFGRTKQITLVRPIITYHVLGTPNSALPEASLVKSTNGELIPIVMTPDDVFMKELAGQSAPQPNDSYHLTSYPTATPYIKRLECLSHSTDAKSQ